MRLRTFTAKNMPAAMEMVRNTLGEDAIIIDSQSLNGSKMISVTAALDVKDEAPAAPKLNGHNGHTHEAAEERSPATDHLRFEVQNVLRFHNLPELFIAKMMQRTTDGDLASSMALHRIGGSHDQRQLCRLAMETLAGTYFTYDPLLADKRDTKLMLVGPPGIGKTLTIAKLAAKLTLEKHKPTVITTDNQRAGGVEQLAAFTQILGLELQVAGSRTELLRQIKTAPKNARVLIDTAGCNAYDDAQIQTLKSYASIDGVEPVLALPAGGDSMETVDMVEAYAELPVKRLLITRADASRRFGAALAAAAAHGLAFCNVSASPSIVDPLQPADAALMAQLLLRYQLQNG